MNQAPTYGFAPGERVTYNFAGSPGGSGVYLGMTDFGYLVVEKMRSTGREVVFLNPALLCTFSPVNEPTILRNGEES